ncbi:hypothetical protein EVAR_64116_1 [Eumeta japonica]|uniref:Uncharacterized protein n=1 Tax=Eumeta variegata TaxID=151549 RepID=A0A4C1Z4V8_EUMVA|nr:hypothetical protein EVAR_64116_1 [Eumeta japonica]
MLTSSGLWERASLSVTSVRVGHTPCIRAHGLSIMDFCPLPSLPFAWAEIQKKTAFMKRVPSTATPRAPTVGLTPLIPTSGGHTVDYTRPALPSQSMVRPPSGRRDGSPASQMESRGSRATRLSRASRDAARRTAELEAAKQLAEVREVNSSVRALGPNGRPRAPAPSALSTTSFHIVFSVQIAAPLRPATLPALPTESPLRRQPPRSTVNNIFYHFRSNHEKPNGVNDVICSVTRALAFPLQGTANPDGPGTTGLEGARRYQVSPAHPPSSSLHPPYPVC